MIIGISGKKQHGKNAFARMFSALEVFRITSEHNLKAWNKEIRHYGKTPLEIAMNVEAEKKVIHFGLYQHKAFADKLKQIAALLFGIDVTQFEDDDFKNSYLPEEWNTWIEEEAGTIDLDIGQVKMTNKILKRYTYREFLQVVGTNLFREQFHPDTWVNATLADYKPVNESYWPQGVPQPKDGMPNWLITDVRFPNEAKAIKDRGGILVRINRVELFPSDDQHPTETALDNYKDFDYTIYNDSDLEDFAKKVIHFQGKLHG